MAAVTARAIMIQGTMSGAGKSLLVAGLCRIFAQDGYRVAPFKSQNMALNSAICADGAEIGRAQAMQAEAAGIEPESAMNPVLLKPTSDTGSQVIVKGRPIGTMAAREYFAYKRNLVPAIMECYRDLASRFDVIVIEGAGSPAEINLKSDDIVNMGVAKRVGAPVLLVGDIDRGGVFAQLAGTMMLLDDDERALVKATVVNKFRGDPEILAPGLRQLESLTGVPVAGVVPYTDADIDEEDSQSERLERRRADVLVDAAVVRLPHLSNYTDFSALDAIEGVGVRYVRNPRDLGSPDLLIVPGTKSTLSDLRWMRESGMEALVKRLAERGTSLIGVCGGYQMLGREVSDPDGVEGAGSLAGLGLLPVRTRFASDKRQVRACGRVTARSGIAAGVSGARIEGYEIHMGETFLDDPAAEPFCMLRSSEGERADGCVAGNVCGTYLHGLFDSPEFTERLVRGLFRAKGLSAEAVRAFDMGAYRARQYDELACAVRSGLDMGLVGRILEEGV
ncbi:cobalamin biosynthesis protein CobQ [Berryella intestinalis]|uniref:Cobyric acid synthase n=1 Tax=Berryella intestinalis TaxID=1531429 RepID=A0A0A8B3V8_9ACTN|nr:cobyric acid synthase [Berryella intestinalis]AJC12181.1 cobalamin biosynthesis protein CobQ [Berryella intestinalis]